jgi:hypothetical protein
MGEFAPTALLAPPGRSRLMHAEPFGPVDTIVVVDTQDELLAAMNASNGALVASIACDNEELAGKLAKDLHAFKVGINNPRSRGRPRRTLRRARRVPERRLRRRGPTGPGRHHGRARRAAVRQLPGLLQLSHHLTNTRHKAYAAALAYPVGPAR